MKHILVYGSLRKLAKRNFNFGRFGVQEFISDAWISGYELHSLGSYPAVCKNPGCVKCELHTVDDETEAAITRMEKGAGYEVHEIEVFNYKLKEMVKAKLYAWPSAPLLAHTRGKVTSGDWDNAEQSLAR
jgi:gamma-glutamylcyclotransferase (GGCT)/AIG2-like uncharacterized protein YtfP